MKISDLTKGERYLLDRRRRSESQKDAAGRLGVSLYCYRAWECDGVEDAPRAPGLGKLQPYEECLIHRKRAEMSARDLAVELGISANWLCEMEAGREDPAPIVDYWGVPCAVAG